MSRNHSAGFKRYAGSYKTRGELSARNARRLLKKKTDVPMAQTVEQAL